MDNELIERVLERLARAQELGTQAALNEDYEAVAFSEDNFGSIEKPEGSPTLCFVDGGNAELLGAASFSLQLVRLHACAYQDNKRVWHDRQEGFVLVSAQARGERVRFTAELFGIEGKQLTIDSQDESLRMGLHRVRASQVAEQARKVLEIRFARELLNRLQNGDIMIRDGDLQQNATGDEEAFADLRDAARGKGIVLCGLSKNTTLLTDTGVSLTMALRRIAPLGAWVYAPLGLPGEGLPALGCVRLHPRSEHVFRIDAYCADLHALAAHLAHNSKDPSFLGYPYGLIEADKLARVARADADAQRVLVLAKGGISLRSRLTAQDAHGILNRLVH